MKFLFSLTVFITAVEIDAKDVVFQRLESLVITAFGFESELCTTSVVLVDEIGILKITSDIIEEKDSKTNFRISMMSNSYRLSKEVKEVVAKLRSLYLLYTFQLIEKIADDEPVRKSIEGISINVQFPAGEYTKVDKYGNPIVKKLRRLKMIHIEFKASDYTKINWQYYIKLELYEKMDFIRQFIHISEKYL